MAGVDKLISQTDAGDKQFRMLAESLNLQVWTSRQNGQIDYISPQCLQYVGLPKAALLGINNWMNRLLHPEDRQWVKDAWLKAIKDQKLLDIEYRILRYDGLYRWFKVRAVPVEQPADGTIRWYGSNTDIHDLRETERALQESQQRYKEVFDNSSDCIYLLHVTDENRFRLVDVNPATEKAIGFKRSDVLGKFIEEIIPETAARKTIDNYQQCVASGKIIEFEERHNTTAGRRYLQTVLIPVPDATHRIHRLIGVARDITESVKAQEALRQQLRMTDAFFNQAITCFCLLDRDLKYVRVNEAWARGFNQKVEDFVGRNTVLFNDSEQYRSYWGHLFEKVAKTKLPMQVRADPYEFAGQPERGVTYWDWTLQPILDENGEVEFFFFSSNDVTDRKKAEDKLEEYRNHLEDLVRQRTDELMEAKEHAEAASRAKSIFLASMSHELRTPLNIILGFTQLMARNAGVDSDQQEILSIIGRSGEHLLALINDVLEMSRIEAGHSVLRKQNFDLHRTIKVVEEMMRSRAEGKGVGLYVHVASDVPQFVRSDDAKLRQVLLNLIGNAVKFTSRGSITLTVAKGKMNSGETDSPDGPVCLCFEVADTGIGISRDQVEHIFDPFVQAQLEKTPLEGTGLGLAISRKFVQEMGGDITVVSTPGRGARFKFSIMAEFVDAADIIRMKQPARRVLRLSSGQPGYRVLITGDISESRLLLKRLIASVGFDVKEAENGAEVIEQFEHWAPHLIWMDLRMPGVNCRDLTQKIKASAKGRQTKIIAISASSFEAEKKAALAAGFDGFVRKPFKETDIFETMATHLGAHYDYGRSKVFPEKETKKALTDSDTILKGLVSLPAEMLNGFEAAAKSLNVTQIRSHVKKIKGVNPELGGALTALAKQFRYDKIISLIAKTKTDR